MLQLQQVAFACADPERVSQFWSALLDYEATAEGSGWIARDPRNEDVPLRFDRQAKSPTIEIPIHLDICVPDHDAARERVIELGGSLVEVKSFRIGDLSDTFTIVRDPEGNGFCLESLTGTDRARVWTVTFASAEPRELARFWASALGWPDEGIDRSIIEQFRAAGVREPDLSRAHILKEPNGRWPRFYFHRREKSPAEVYPVHLHLVTDDRRAEIDRLSAAGASVVADEGTLTVMRDPERNPFSVGDAPTSPWARSGDAA